MESPTIALQNSQKNKYARVFQQGWDYYQTLFNDLALLGQDTPYSKGSISCEIHGAFWTYLLMYYIRMYAYVCACT